MFKTLSTPRGNEEMTRNRRFRKAPIKGHRLTANYGEIAAKFVIYPPEGFCGASSTVIRAYDYV